MKYHDIGSAIAGMIDQTTRGMTDHEYELHIKRLRRYGNKIMDIEDYISVWENEPESPEYKKAVADLEKYKQKLADEKVRGL